MTLNKEIILYPSHKAIFWWYLLGIVLVPFFGLGIYLIYRFYKEHKSIHYVITDLEIKAVNSTHTEKVDVINITETRVESNFTDKMLGIGHVIIKTNSRLIKILGQENPDQLSDMILRAAESERKRVSLTKKRSEETTKHNPGSLDKLDYLTGLWQQGLLSDEDYQNERKHFE